MGIFRTLYIDLDSFYASVELQLNPELRGRPVGVTAVDSDAGAIVAASYEAKAQGIGVSARESGEAKRICPGIALIGSRHRVYARMNRKSKRLSMPRSRSSASARSTSSKRGFRTPIRNSTGRSARRGRSRIAS